MTIITIAVLLLFTPQQLSKEETARRLYNQALLAASMAESDKILERIIKEFPTTVAATEAIKLRRQHDAERVLAEQEHQRLEERLEQLKEQRKQQRTVALGGFDVTEITSHGLSIPVPNTSVVKRSGANPEIITSALRNSDIRVSIAPSSSSKHWRIAISVLLRVRHFAQTRFNKLRFSWYSRK